VPWVNKKVHRLWRVVKSPGELLLTATEEDHADAGGADCGYKEPLRLEEIPVPDIGSDEVLIKVAAARMCRSNFQLVDGYFQEGLPVSFLITPGHEVAGTIAALGGMCRDRLALSEGELIVGDPNWGDGVCPSVS